MASSGHVLHSPVFTRSAIELASARTASCGELIHGPGTLYPPLVGTRPRSGHGGALANSGSTRLQAAKGGGRVPRVAPKGMREVAGAAEPNLRRDLPNCKCGLAKQKLSSRSHPLFHHIGVRWHADSLAECALEVSGTDPRDLGEAAQGNRLGEAVVNVVQDNFQAPRRQPSFVPARRHR
jgi:hypothetical protein